MLLVAVAAWHLEVAERGVRGGEWVGFGACANRFESLSSITLSPCLMMKSPFAKLTWEMGDVG